MVGHEDARPASGNQLSSLHPDANAGHEEAGANNEAGNGIERSDVAGDHGQRNEDQGCGQAQYDNDDKYDK
jgi:hypothetical protein